jgi:cytochrome c-type biogenesis protein CcmH/NrfF
MQALLQVVALLAISQGHTGGEDVNAPARELGIDPNKLISLSQQQKDYAHEIGDELVCLCGTCPRFTVANCDCGWAAQSMNVIKVALTEGKTRDQIHSAYEKAYGTKAFPKPPGTLGELTWLIPYVGGLLLLAALFAFGVKQLRKRNPMASVASGSKPGEESSEDRERLRRELEDLD